MSGFKFNGKHINEEFPHLKLVDRSVLPPKETTIKESIIGMQGDYDFSIDIFGERLYENREITYSFNGKESNDLLKSFNKRKLENWLLNGSYMPLYDDKETNYYYIAKCIYVELESDNGVLKAPYTITFEAYPFKIKESVEGSPYWDDYDITDYYQKVEYTINGTQQIKMMNTGTTSVAPELELSSQMTLKKDGEQFVVPAGTRTIEDFRFEIGMNRFTVTGNGTIKFNWHKEVI